MFKLHKLRLGLACNSSSSHSLIILPDGVKLDDDWGWSIEEEKDRYSDLDDEMKEIMMEGSRKQFERLESGEEYNFGWSFFTATSKKTKQQYLGQVLWNMLIRELPEKLATPILRDWMGIDLKEGYIDHQSLWELPCEYNTRFPDREFYDELSNFILNDRVAVLGGNDNDENSHPQSDLGETAFVTLPEDGHSYFVCRKDKTYDFWTFFWPETGAKTRVTINNKVEPERASVPELVDIKINDYCPFACKFCYQDSTADKGHSDPYALHYLFDELGQHKVFEVALGGGEPTMHPAFVNILRSAREKGIVPNFTTKNIGWLRDPGQCAEIMQYAGAFAFSVERAEEIEKIATLVSLNKISKSKVNIQIVMGTLNEWEFAKIVEACYNAKISLTLLGYKITGRGSEFKPEPYKWWLKVIKKLHKENKVFNLCIDTAIAKEYEQEILDAGIPKYVFEINEGKFSMYVDAVAKKVGPSSYCENDQFIDWDFTKRWGNEAVDLPTIYNKLNQ